MERVVLKLSGQALSSDGRGIDVKKIDEVVNEVIALKNKGYQIGIVCGAGNFWRGRDAEGMSRVSADNIGMLGTVMNALALQESLIRQGQKAIVFSAISMPQVAQTFSATTCNEYLDNGYIALFAGGTGNPYFSTDTCAALRAGQIGAHKILMAKTGVDGVYDDDPRKNPKAKRFIKLTYDEMLKRNLGVMDLTAAILCQDNDIKTVVFDMNVKGNITKIVENENIGTIVEKGE